jgi:tetratricopeptide (TPR) repeat protein
VASELGLQAARRLGDRNAEGRLHVHEKRYAEATDCLGESLAIFHEIGDRFAEAQSLRTLGIVLEEEGKPEAAREHWHEAIAILDPLNTAEANKIQGWLDESDQPRSWWIEWRI